MSHILHFLNNQIYPKGRQTLSVSNQFIQSIKIYVLTYEEKMRMVETISQSAFNLSQCGRLVNIFILHLCKGFLFKPHVKNQPMEQKQRTNITISATVNAPVEKVWKYWTTPDDVMKWNNASDDWHTPSAENDLRVGGSFKSRMEARDGSMGFDFGGIYDEVKPNERIAYTLGDGRKVLIVFTNEDGKTRVEESFEAEGTNPVDMQRAGWQAILDNFKKYAEGK